MSYDYSDYTQNCNFPKELDERNNFPITREVVGEVELDNSFYAELVKAGKKPDVIERITV